MTNGQPEAKRMSRRQADKAYNKVRFAVVEGHGILYIIDHQKNVCHEYKFAESFTPENNRSTREYLDEVLLCNGWKHVRQVEDALSEDAS